MKKTVKAYAVTEIRRVGFTPLHGRVLLDLVMHFATNARADPAEWPSDLRVREFPDA